ncbi:MAG: ABC transporter permease [Promethearchaeota archaeon]
MSEIVEELGLKPKSNANGKEEDEISPFLDNALKQLGWAVGSIILSFLVATLIMLAAGYNPGLALGSLMSGALRNIDQVFWFATPLILTGLSVAVAFKAGLFNIGAEGQLQVGAITAAIVGFMIALPVVVHPIVCLLVAAICGGLYGLIPGLLKAYRGAHEVVTTMMLSYTAVYVTNWLVTGPLKEPGELQWIPQTPLLYPSAWLPPIFGPFLHWGFFLAIICVIAVYFFLNKTVLGYEMRAVGLNLQAAEYGGINPKRMVSLAMAFSGALAGLAGAGEIMGTYQRFKSGWSPGLGFDGITVAVLGNNSPLGVLLGAIFFGFLRAGGLTMQVTAHVPVEMIGLIQGLIVLFVAVPSIINWLARRGVSHAKWVQKEPMNALPIFVTIVITVIGASIGFGIGFLTLPINFLIAIVLITIGFIGLASFYGMLAMKKWGPIAALILSVAWIPVGIANLIFQSGNLLIPLLVLGVAGIILSGFSFYLVKWKGIKMGDEF